MTTKERIEANLKKLPEINKNRPCHKCIHSRASTDRYYKNSCAACNFNHDRFEAVESRPKSDQSTR